LFVVEFVLWDVHVDVKYAAVKLRLWSVFSREIHYLLHLLNPWVKALYDIAHMWENDLFTKVIAVDKDLTHAIGPTK